MIGDRCKSIETGKFYEMEKGTDIFMKGRSKIYNTIGVFSIESSSEMKMEKYKYMGKSEKTTKFIYSPWQYKIIVVRNRWW